MARRVFGGARSGRFLSGPLGILHLVARCILRSARTCGRLSGFLRFLHLLAGSALRGRRLRERRRSEQYSAGYDQEFPWHVTSPPLVDERSQRFENSTVPNLSPLQTIVS